MKKDKAPLYAKIKEYLKDQMDSGLLKPGDQVPTEAELMNRFGVSRITVTSAIRHLVEEGLVYRIAGKGSFVQSDHSSAAKPLRRIPTKKEVIGFILHPARDMFMHRLLLGIEEACRENGYGLMVRLSMTQNDELQAIEDLRSSGVKGLIIHPLDGEAYNEAILKLQTERFPFVLVDRYLPGIRTNAVYSDNYEGGRLAADFLIRLGHRVIGVVSSPKSKTSSAEDRFQGYLEAVRAKNLPIQAKHWLTRLDDDSPIHDEISIKEAIEEWLSEGLDMSAVFTIQSLDAIYIASIADKLGIRVPEDLSILSFDNPGISDLYKHYFSHVEQNLELMGAEAVELLIRAIHNPDTSEQIKIPVTLIEGRSTRSVAE